MYFRIRFGIYHLEIKREQIIPGRYNSKACRDYHELHKTFTWYAGYQFLSEHRKAKTNSDNTLWLKSLLKKEIPDGAPCPATYSGLL